MKVTVDIDCTPEEARRFMGLPDLSPVHEAYVQQMQKMVAEGPSPEAFADMIKSWGTLGATGMNLWSGMASDKSGKK